MLLKDIETNFPFLSIVQYGGNEYVGIINNQDNFVTSMYVYTMLRTDEEKKHFIDSCNHPQRNLNKILTR